MKFQTVAKYEPLYSKPMTVGWGEGDTMMEAVLNCIENLDYTWDDEPNCKDLYKDTYILISDGVQQGSIRLIWVINDEI